MMKKLSRTVNYSFELPLDNNKKYFEVTSQRKNEKGIVEGVVQVYRDRTEAKILRFVQRKTCIYWSFSRWNCTRNQQPSWRYPYFSQMLLKNSIKKVLIIKMLWRLGQPKV